MKKYTIKDKIEEIELGIKILSVEREGLCIRNQMTRLCDSMEISKDIELIDLRIKNMQYRIDQLDVDFW